MKSRTSKRSTNAKPGKGLSQSAKVAGAMTVAALAGGLVGAVIANRRRKKSAISKTAQKVKGWVKSAVKSPTLKSLAKSARQVAASQLSDRSSGRGQSESALRATVKNAGKAKRRQITLRRHRAM